MTRATLHAGLGVSGISAMGSGIAGWRSVAGLTIPLRGQTGQGT